MNIASQTLVVSTPIDPILLTILVSILSIAFGIFLSYRYLFRQICNNCPGQMLMDQLKKKTRKSNPE